RPPPTPALSPYTTLFRSTSGGNSAVVGDRPVTGFGCFDHGLDVFAKPWSSSTCVDGQLLGDSEVFSRSVGFINKFDVFQVQFIGQNIGEGRGEAVHVGNYHSQFSQWQSHTAVGTFAQ